MTDLNDKSASPPKGIRKADAIRKTIKYKEELFELQNVLFAEHKHSVLIILQGMDAAGKDSTIRHVFSAMNPMGVNIRAFKAPTAEEKSHDFLWRVHRYAPELGMIEVFNRSHYEDILVPFVHEPDRRKELEYRFDSINSFEKTLQDEGTVILKFFLHVSKEEQANRLKERVDIQRKYWKYDPADTREVPFHKDYLKVYEKIFERCSPKIPWIIVPADHRWYRNYIVAQTLTHTLRALKMKYPPRTDTKS